MADRVLDGRGGEFHNTRIVVESGTITRLGFTGAESLGLGDQIGTIAPGYQGRHHRPRR